MVILVYFMNIRSVPFLMSQRVMYHVLRFCKGRKEKCQWENYFLFLFLDFLLALVS